MVISIALLKKYLIILLSLVCLAVLLYFVLDFLPKQPKYRLLDSLFNTNNYVSYSTSVESEDLYRNSRFNVYTKDQGLVTFTDKEKLPISFDFKTQYLYKNTDSKWDIYLKDLEESQYIPGSVESLLGLGKSEIDVNKFEEKTELDRCDFLDLGTNCIGYMYKSADTKYEIYFKKDETKLAYIRITYSDNSITSHMFSRVNDQAYKKVREFFAIYQNEIEKDIRLSLE